MKMLDPSFFRAPKILNSLLRPTLLPKNKKLDHNWGDIFLFPTFFIMRVYAFTQPPHILPKYIRPRLSIIEFMWHLFMVNREYLGPKVHKVIFLYMSFRIGDFSIGKESLDQIHAFLCHYNLSTDPYIIYDPEGYMRNTLKEIRGYVFPNTRESPQEDLITNLLVEGEAIDKLAKFDDVLRVENELKREDPSFKGFYLDVPYPCRIRKMVDEYIEITTQMQAKIMGEEGRVNLDFPEPDVVLEVEEEEPAEASWVSKGKKRKKVIQILEKVK